ncbi:MAG: 2-amino-4-hydroxy-6-hydroxymethyldihydropteridine diphosphokinase [Pseudomonadota bacterium]
MDAIALLAEAERNTVNSRSEMLIALGANLPSAIGAPMATLREALRLMGESGFSISAAARWRRAPAFPAGSGPDFVNGAVLARADLAPREALSRLHEIEARMGRTRDRRWEPRICDLDLIACGDFVAPDAATVRALMAATGAAARAAPDDLILPHPRMHERGFVLAPLADVAPGWRHPLTGATVAEMLAVLPPEARAEIEVIDG